MSLYEFFFGPIEMPVRANRQLVDCGVACVRKAIVLEQARTAEEARREKERERESPEEREPDVRYHTRIRWPSGLEPIGLPDQPQRKRPPNLKADKLSFAAQLLTFVREKCDGRGVVAYQRAGVRRNVYSRIVSDDGSQVNKRTALQFCIGLQLGRDDAELLLRSAGYALSGTIPEDIAFAYCIDNAIWNLEDVNEILSRCGFKTIETDAR